MADAPTGGDYAFEWYCDSAGGGAPSFAGGITRNKDWFFHRDINVGGKITNTLTSCSIDSFKTNVAANSLFFFINGVKFAAVKP
jgi:hypothetical protein